MKTINRFVVKLYKGLNPDCINTWQVGFRTDRLLNTESKKLLKDEREAR